MIIYLLLVNFTRGEVWLFNSVSDITWEWWLRNLPLHGRELNGRELNVGTSVHSLLTEIPTDTPNNALSSVIMAWQILDGMI